MSLSQPNYQRCHEVPTIHLDVLAEDLPGTGVAGEGDRKKKKLAKKEQAKKQQAREQEDRPPPCITQSHSPNA
ncbi:hypothetical protein EST38_g13922 [Candolleomyces aberdarensis]|uniref:Uncharacterized protein n=1 Tax=Candolleomyces aberdarensis TaxID=2316362 RepID=A0A4Q2D113_9AGAR|nr:hypothetical protein EST38_g13922 [Candolleomyces aberdarensis]